MGEKVKLVSGRKGGVGRRGLRGEELYMRGEREKKELGRRGGVGRSGFDRSYKSWMIGEMEKSSVGSKGGGGNRGGGRGVVVLLVLVWLLVKGLGPGFGSIPARSRRVATNERGRKEEKKRGGVGGLWQKRVRVSGRQPETSEKKAMVERKEWE